uniref:DUF4440 domain-containing protein n=1 Tax=Macrostomum lignano TaxID=282301 RepID=A0A1I8FGA1_9PLAT
LKSKSKQAYAKQKGFGQRQKNKRGNSGVSKLEQQPLSHFLGPAVTSSLIGRGSFALSEQPASSGGRRCPGIGEETPYRLKERPHQQRLQAIAKMPTAAKLTLCFIAACALLDSLSCRAAAAPHAVCADGVNLHYCYAWNVKRALLRSPPVDVPTRSVDESDVRPLSSYLRQRQDSWSAEQSSRFYAAKKPDDAAATESTQAKAVHLRWQLRWQVGLQGGWQDELLADGQSWRLRQLPHNDFSPAAGQADCQGQPGAAAGQHGAVGAGGSCAADRPGGCRRSGAAWRGCRSPAAPAGQASGWRRRSPTQRQNPKSASSASMPPPKPPLSAPASAGESSTGHGQTQVAGPSCTRGGADGGGRFSVGERRRPGAAG